MQHKSKNHMQLNVDDILENISDGFFILNHQKIFIYFNAAAERLLGRKREQILGRHIFSEAFPQLEGSVFEKKYSLVLKNKRPVFFDTCLSEGSFENWYHVRVYPFEQGVLVYFQPLTESKRSRLQLAASYNASINLVEDLSIEINERKKNEELQKKEKQFTDTVLDAQLDTVFLFDPKNGKAIRWNKAFREKSGYTDLEISTQKAPDFYYSPEDLKKAKRFTKQVLEQGTGSIELNLICKDGKKIPTEYAVSVIKDENDQTKYLIAIGRDITERKNAEIALRESEELYRQLFEAESDAIFLIDNSTGNIIEANSAAADLYGYTIEELRQKKNTDLSAEKKRTRAVTKDTPIIKDKILRIPLRFHRKKDGSVFPVEITGHFFRWKGRSVHIAAIRDISDRHHAEKELEESKERFKKLFDFAPDAYYLSDLKGHFIDGNKAAEKLIGYKKQELIGKGFFELNLIPKDQRVVAAKVLAENALGKATGPDEIVLIRKNKNPVTVDVCAYPLELDGKKVVLGIARDISERKKSEASIRKERDRAQMYLDLAGVMFVALDKKGTILVANRKACSILKRKEKELLNKNWFDMAVPEQERKNVKDVFKKLMTGQVEPVEFYENDVINKRGEKRLIAWHNTILKDEKGEIVGTLSSGEDITERKRAEEALKKSAAEWRTTFDATTDAICLVDKNQKIVRSNKSMAEMFQMRVQDLIGKKCWQIIHGRTKPVPECPFSRMKITLKRESMELFLNTLWFEVTVDPILNENQELTGAVHIVRNITERKTAERELLDSYETYNNMVQFNPSGIFVYQYQPPASLVLLAGNNAAEISTGIEIKKWLGKEFNEIWPEAKKAGITDAYLRVIHTGKTFATENLYYKDDRLAGAFKINAFKIPENRLVVAFENVTERIKAEHELQDREKKIRSIFRAAPVGIGVVLNRVLQQVNEQICSMTGYSNEELVGQSARILYPSQEDFDFVGREKYFQIREKGTGTVETRWQKKNGKVIDVILSSTPLYANDLGKGVTFTAMDITDRKRAQEAIEKHRKELQNLSNQLIRVQEEERRRISRELHDELGQQLTGIKLYVATMQNIAMKGENKQVESILYETDKLVEDLITQMHNIALDLRPNMLDDLGLVPTLRWYVKQRAEMLKCSIKLDIETIKERLNSECETALYRIVQESLNNIAKHAKAENVFIQLTKSESRVRLSIKDDGIGFDLEKMERKEQEKRGIGLIGMQERVAALHGELGIFTAPDDGTKIIVEIPILC